MRLSFLLCLWALSCLADAQECPRPRFPHPRPSCGCSVSRQSARTSRQAARQPSAAPRSHRTPRDRRRMALIPAGDWWVGTDTPVLEGDGEGPARRVTLPAFWMDEFEVSRREFAQFVAATGHVTEAEQFGTSFVLQSLLAPDTLSTVTQAVAGAPWWVPVSGANWSRPVGGSARPVSEEEWRLPAVHVSWNDAAAFCRWRSKRLPREAEWEVACRGGLQERLFPWGNKEMPRGRHRMNIWHGRFPSENTADDGFKGLAPVDALEAQNRFGLFHMVGNVWEWTADWWDTRSRTDRVKKGGSFMCHKSYCYRYRCAARGHNTPDTSSINVGFRCAADH